GEREDHPWLAAWRPNGAQNTIDECRLRTAQTADKGPRHRLAAADFGPTEFERSLVDAHHHRGIEMAQQRLEIAVSRGGQERANETAMMPRVWVCGGLCRPDPTSCTAGQLPSGDGALP